MSFKTCQSQTEDKKARVKERKETWSAAFIKALKMFLKMEDKLIKKGKSERERRKTTETLNSSKNKVKDKTFNEVKRYNKKQQMKDNQNS